MNIRGTSANDFHRIAMVGYKEVPAKEAGKEGFVLAAFRACNDTLSPEQIADGKGQTAPMLTYNKYKDKNTGEEKVSNWSRISKSQYDKIMEIANLAGDKPVFEAQVFPKNGGILPNTNTLRKPDNPYNHEKDVKNTQACKDVAAAKRASKEESLAATQEHQMQAAVATTQATNDQPQLG